MAERRPGGQPSAAGGPGGAAEPAAAAAAEGTAGGPAASAAASCPVALCPVAMAMTLAGSIRPEVVEHLLAAGRELMLAVKAVLDSRAAGFEPRSPVERIEIG